MTQPTNRNGFHETGSREREDQKKQKKTKKKKKKDSASISSFVFGYPWAWKTGGRGPLQKGVCHKNKNKKTPPSGVKPMARNMCISDFFLHRRGEFILF